MTAGVKKASNKRLVVCFLVSSERGIIQSGANWEVMMALKVERQDER